MMQHGAVYHFETADTSHDPLISVFADEHYVMHTRTRGAMMSANKINKQLGDVKNRIIIQIRNVNI